MKFEGELARRTETGIEIRTAPLRVAWRFSNLPTSDDHLIDVKFSCSIRAIDNPTERAMLAEVFLTDCETASVDHVVSHFNDALRTAATNEASKLSVEDALNADFKTPLKSAADAIAFSCGVEVVAPIEASVESPTLQQQKIESLQRHLAERRAAGQVEHFQRARELLKDFQSMRDAEPGLSPSRILQNISEVDRGAMLQTLLLASGDGEQASLWAVSGESLVRIDPRVSPPTLHTIAMPTTHGPLRSIRAIENQLLIGARNGVIVTDRDGGNVQTYKAPDTTSSMAFNSVAISRGAVWASHSELGVVGWRIGESDIWRVREHGGAKNLLSVDDSRVIYSAGSEIWLITSSGETLVKDGAGSTIVAMIPSARNIFIIREDGIVQQLDRAALQLVKELRPANDISSAGALPWFGDVRLLLATVDGPIVCAGVDDSLVTHYTCAHRGFKSIAGAGDCVAALSGDRQRIVLWQSWNPAKPSAEIHLAGITRHRIGDLCFA